MSGNTELRLYTDKYRNGFPVPATPADLIEAVSKLEGAELKWLLPNEGELLSGTLWHGPPTTGDGRPVLVVPLDVAEEPRSSGPDWSTTA